MLRQHLQVNQNKIKKMKTLLFILLLISFKPNNPEIYGRLEKFLNQEVVDLETYLKTQKSISNCNRIINKKTVVGIKYYAGDTLTINAYFLNTWSALDKSDYDCKTIKYKKQKIAYFKIELRDSTFFIGIPH